MKRSTPMTISSRLKYTLECKDKTLPDGLKSIPYETDTHFVYRDLESQDLYIYIKGVAYHSPITYIRNIPSLYKENSLLDIAKSVCEKHSEGRAY